MQPKRKQTGGWGAADASPVAYAGPSAQTHCPQSAPCLPAHQATSPSPYSAQVRPPQDPPYSGTDPTLFCSGVSINFTVDLGLLGQVSLNRTKKDCEHSRTFCKDNGPFAPTRSCVAFYHVSLGACRLHVALGGAAVCLCAPLPPLSKPPTASSLSEPSKWGNCITSLWPGRQKQRHNLLKATAWGPGAMAPVCNPSTSRGQGGW